MTMPMSNLGLPPPGYPMVTRVISNRIFPPDSTEVAEGRGNEPVVWVWGERHPFVPTMRVVRMFVVRSGSVEVYSTADNGRDTMRNLLPSHTVRFVEEVMPPDIFIEELAAAEAGENDEPEPDVEPDDPDLPDGPTDPANEPSSPVPA